MRTLPGRRYAAAAATAVLLLSLAACGSDADNASDTPTPTTSASTTDGATPSGKEIDPTAFARRMTDAFSEMSTAHVSMQIDAQGAVISASGDVDYSGDAPEMALAMSSPSFGSGKVEMRLVDGAMYMSLPKGAGDPGMFYKIDLDDPDNPLGASLGDLSSFDPRKTFDMFSTGVQKVVELGDEDVEGDATTHYQVTTGTAEIKKSLSKELRHGFPATLTFDIWLAEGDKLRKMTADLPGTGAITLETTNWGEPVDIKAPPAKRVAVLPQQ
jgi:hypothetical protein